jgi:hypothetical protein
MNRAILLGALVLLAAPVAPAQRVDTGTLGALTLQYATVQASDHYAGPPMAAQVSFQPGEAFSVVTPYRIQQITWLVSPGESVTAGQPVAVLAGPEIHHFITEFEVTGERLALARKRFESNRKLYRDQSIDEGRWIEISDAYYRLRLAYEHLQHFHELLQETDSEPDNIVLKSPTAGRLQYAQNSPGVPAEGEVAIVIPPSALRLRVAVPLARREGLAALRNDGCELAVSTISGIAEGFFLRAWSEPLGPRCPWLPGEQLMVTPQYRLAGYTVPQSALLHWEGEPALLLRDGGELQLVAVAVSGANGDGYHVTSDIDLAGREVLTSSVSAVQGVLLGLGSD